MNTALAILTTTWPMQIVGPVIGVVVVAPWAILGWIVRLIVQGRLVPGSELEWARQSLARAQAQVEEMLVTGRLARTVLRAAMPDEASEDVRK